MCLSFKYLIGLCFCVVFALESFTQQSIYLTSLGGVCSKGPWAINNNQAGILAFDKKSVGLYSSNNYGIKGFYDNAISAVLPISKETIGFSYLSKGLSFFKDHQFKLAYARSLLDGFSLGLALGCSTGKSEFGLENTDLLLELGGLIKLNDDLDFGFHIRNPFQFQATDRYYQTLGASLSVGLAYSPVKSFKLGWDFVKQNTDALASILILHYAFNDKFGLNGHLELNKAVYKLGFIYIINKSIVTEFVIDYHRVLGASPGLSLSLIF